MVDSTSETRSKALQGPLTMSGVIIFKSSWAFAREEFYKLGNPGKNLYNFGTIFNFFDKKSKKNPEIQFNVA